MSTFLGINFQQLGKLAGKHFAYWQDAMLSVLPRGLQSKLRVGTEALIVELSRTEIRLLSQTLDEVTPLFDAPRQDVLLDDGTLSPDFLTLLKKHLSPDRRLLLCVDDRDVLSKCLDFPVAVAENLRQVVWYEMDKHTPFAKGEVLFDVVVLGQHGALMQTELYLLHKDRVMPLVQGLQLAKIRFDAIYPTRAEKINLLPEPLRRRHFSLNKKNTALSLLLCVMIALLAIVPLAFKRQTAIALEREISLLTPQAADEPTLWETRDNQEQQFNEFLAAYPAPFLVFYEALNQLLPNDAWVNYFTYDYGNVIIRGEARDAAGLIRLINQNPLFNSARIVSPIVKQRNSDKETFNLNFQTVQTRGEAVNALKALASTADKTANNQPTAQSADEAQ